MVDLFVPKNTMSVYYGTKHVTNGCDVKPYMSVDPPNIQIAGLRPDLYTLVYMIFTVNFFFLACMLDIYLLSYGLWTHFFGAGDDRS